MDIRKLWESLKHDPSPWKTYALVHKKSTQGELWHEAEIGKYPLSEINDHSLKELSVLVSNCLFCQENYASKS